MTEQPRILNAEPRDYSEKALARLASFAQVDSMVLDRAGLLTALPGYDALIVRFAFHIDCEVLDAAPRLRVVACAATGLDHVDLDAARNRGVAVLSLSGERAFLDTVPASAEHTLALLLSLTRRIPLAIGRVNAGIWDRDALRGHDLCGKTLGLVGLGRVGTKMAGYCLALGMRVLAYDKTPPSAPPGVNMAATLDELLQRSEVLSIHAPLTPETEGLIGARELALLPAGAILVNTARGELLDEGALIAALDSGRLAGAALDVVRNEPTSHTTPNTPLLRAARRLDNLLVTPHIGGATWESMEKTELFIADRLNDFFRVGPPAHTVEGENTQKRRRRHER